VDHDVFDVSLTMISKLDVKYGVT